MQARVVLLTQGGLGREVVRSAGEVVGELPAAEVIELPWSATSSEAEEALAAALERGEPSDVLVLTDLYGSTPDRAARRLASDRLAVVSGLNLAMLVCLCCSEPRGENIAELASWVRTKAVRSIACEDPNGAGGTDGGSDE